MILLLTIVAVGLFRFVPNIFFPPNERGQFVVEFELPMGTDIVETESRVQELEQWLLEKHKFDVRNVVAWIGGNEPRWYLSMSPAAPSPNYAFLSVLTNSDDPQQVQELI